MWPRYPVFPWVLANYTSPDLDLDDPSVRGAARQAGRRGFRGEDDSDEQG